MCGLKVKTDAHRDWTSRSPDSPCRCVLRVRVQGLGFRVWGSGFRVQGLGFSVMEVVRGWGVRRGE